MNLDNTKQNQFYHSKYTKFDIRIISQHERSEPKFLDMEKLEINMLYY